MAAPVNSSASTNPVGCLMRITWILLANVMLFFAAMLVIRDRSAGLSVYDILFAASVVAGVVARYVEIRFFDGTTDTGQRATISDWIRYTVMFLLAAAVVMGGAHGLAWLLSK